MEIKNLVLIVLAGIVCVALVFFLIYKNKQDLKSFHPDATDATEEIHNDQERNREKI